ncbi:putative oligoribonuclease isoform X1 [Andrena cerasifolii]|uniref:putative oligoribonuclease isoform X1 n=2 Tax=Andrena cerasifolii TaxID=2819439 RepID=UPI004037D0D2
MKMIFTRGFKWSKNCLQLIIPRNSQKASATAINMEKKNWSNHIVWLDMEMTGLDVHTSHILEVACVVTDNDLKIVSDDLNVIVHQPNEILESMNDWSIKMHKKTGLVDESRLSKITIQDAERMVLKHLQTYAEEGICPLAGSSVYMDRRFLQKYMPAVDNYLHYRIIDTSTIKELINRWTLSVPALVKRHDHRALSDIKESIRELEHYRTHLCNL